MAVQYMVIYGNKLCGADDQQTHDADDFQAFLNNQAKEGWRFVHIITPSVLREMGRTFAKDGEYLVVFRKGN